VVGEGGGESLVSAEDTEMPRGKSEAVRQHAVWSFIKESLLNIKMLLGMQLRTN
jgi:hypothetical protein